MRCILVRSLLPALAVLAASLTGCTAHDARTEALRKQFVLVEEPPGAATIADSREQAAADDNVVVVGRISGGEVEPWADGQAAFMIAEALPADDGHADAAGHDPTTCPFCRRRAEKANATALVQFNDEQGKLLAIDARKLLGVAKNQTVVVQGQGHVNDLGVLVIAAKGIHVRK
ncbi:MAG: hypothetical protein WD845_17250 [Pirellulales bacterium]